jgi:hypothetical protein
MGGGNWSGDSYLNLKANYATKTDSEIFSQALDKTLDPKGVKFRESRDSDAHPESVAIMVLVDVTGSMGGIPKKLLREKLGALMETLIKHGVADAQVFFGAVGDQYSDDAPLQVGQFEAGTEELNECLSKIFIEGGGGGGGTESYLLGHYFASRHTSIDCFEKRGEKGFLFTIGDEQNHEMITPQVVQEIFGDNVETDLTPKELVKEAERMYHVFHIHANDGSYPNNTTILNHWNELLPERVIKVEDSTTIAEVIASTVAVVRGADLKKVVKDFDKATGDKVSTALAKVNTGSNVTTRKKNEGIITL